MSGVLQRNKQTSAIILAAGQIANSHKNIIKKLHLKRTVAREFEKAQILKNKKDEKTGNTVVFVITEFLLNVKVTN